MKGQSPIIQYVFIIALSVIVFTAVVLLGYSIYRQIIQSELSSELKQIVLQTSDSVLKLYQTGKSSSTTPSNGSVVLLGELNLNLPQQTTQRNYELSFQSTSPTVIVITSILYNGQNVTFTKEVSGARILAKTTGDPFVSQDSLLPNIGATLQGIITNGHNATLRYYRYNFNNTVYDSIVLGDSSILVQITAVN